MNGSTQTTATEIHIALGFDHNYIVHVYPMITSVFHNNRRHQLVLHVITTGLSDNEKAEFVEYVNQNNAKVIFYDITHQLKKEHIYIPSKSYFTVATFYRLFFPDLIPTSVKKLLYLDPDTIILSDLVDLYNLNIDTAPIAAVPDPYFECREELGIKRKGEYFNAGVMLINVAYWRLQKVTEKVLSFVKNNPEKVPYLDQDALNAILAGKWIALDVKYNFTLTDVKLKVPAKQLVKEVAIVHFTSYRKPWLSLSTNKLRYLYHHYLKLSGKAKGKTYIDFKWDIKSLWIFIRIRLKEFYFEHRLDKVIRIKRLLISPELDY